MEYTQGEWEYFNNGHFYEVGTWEEDKFRFSCNVFINRIGKRGGVKDDSLCKENEANAKLIAAAPELLKALELIASNSNDHAMIRIAHKAINKATK